MNANFFEAAPDPATNPNAYAQQRGMAAQLTQRGTAPQQGQMVNGHYVAPSATSYASQLASALMGGHKNSQLRDASRASDILNGGTGAVPPLQRLGGLFGGGV